MAARSAHTPLLRPTTNNGTAASRYAAKLRTYRAAGVPWRLGRRRLRAAMPGIPREDLPRVLAPMLCATGLPQRTDGWQLQIKFDGIRGQFRADRRGWTLRSRAGP